MDDPAAILFSTPEMASVWSAAAQVRGLLTFEAALARAQARAGIIPAVAAETITSACHEDGIDTTALFREASEAGTPVIPLVRLLTERLAASGNGGDASGYVHWGATSQDALDSALVAQMRDGLDVVSHDLTAVAAACASLVERYRDTPLAGRTLLQQALPIPFGLKAARWLALTTRQLRRLGEVKVGISVVQLGGAAGTLASLADAGMRVTELLAEELGLSVPDLPWHAERDRVAEVAAALGVVAGAMGKIAGDLVLLAQSEVAEVSEAGGPHKGASSAMPQKRNPVDATLARAAARLAIGQVPIVLEAMAQQEHERAAGAWQSEWAALPDLFRFTAGAVAHVRDALQGLRVDPDRMRANVAQSHGLLMAEALTMALAPHAGRQAAHGIVRELTERVLATGSDLWQAALADEHVRAALTTEQVEVALDPARYMGSAGTLIDRALGEYRALRT